MPADPISYVARLSCLKDYGVSVSIDELRAEFARHGWRQSFYELAWIAAQIAGSDPATAAVQQHLRDALGVKSLALIANEEAIYFLQSIALSAGGDVDKELGFEKLGWSLLAANDYLECWSEEDTRSLSRTESLVAGIARSTQFNRINDPVTELVRSCSILEAIPRRTACWNTNEDWLKLQKDAFGMSLSEYVRSFAGPIMSVLPHAWSSLDRPPVLAVSELIKLLPFPESTSRDLLSELTLDLSSDLDQTSTHALLLRPFVSFESDIIVPVSPRAVREHLVLGLWGRMSLAARRQGRSKDWSPAFGDLVEQWCQRVALLAAKSPDFGATVIADHPDDEIEDVVFHHKNQVALVSVKSRILKKELFKVPQSRSYVLDHFEEFFFKKKSRKYRPGAMRLLHSKALQVHAGEYEQLPPEAEIFPIVVTYEDYGLDSIVGHEYLNQRCMAEELFTDAHVRPPLCISLEIYESLLACVAEGHNLFELLLAKVRRPHVTLSNILLEETGRHRYRLPAILDSFELLTKEFRLVRPGEE